MPDVQSKPKACECAICAYQRAKEGGKDQDARNEARWQKEVAQPEDVWL